MTLLHIDGFDHYGDDETKMTEGIYDQVDAEFSLSISNPRTSVFCLNRDNTAVDARLIKNFDSSNITLGFGEALSLSQLPSNNYSYAIASLLDSTGSDQITFVVNSDGSIRCLLGSISGLEIANSEPNVFYPSSYIHFEVGSVADQSGVPSEVLFFAERFNNGLAGYEDKTDAPGFLGNYTIVSDDFGSALKVVAPFPSHGYIAKQTTQALLTKAIVKFKVEAIAEDDTAYIRLLDSAGDEVFTLHPKRQLSFDPLQRASLNSPGFSTGVFISDAVVDVDVWYRVEIIVDSDASTVDATLYINNTDEVVKSVTGIAVSSDFIPTELNISTEGDLPNPGFGQILFDDIELYTMSFENPNGIVEVRVNGVTVISESGIANRMTDEKSYAGLAVQSGSQIAHGVTTDIDDLFVWDDQGSWNNSFLGDRRCYFLKPNQDTNIADFDPSSGSFGYKMIDDEAPDDDSTYIIAEAYLQSGSPLSGTSEFEIEDLPNGCSLISGVSVVTRASKTDSTSAEIFTSINSGADSLSQGAHTLTTSYRYYSDIYEYDPSNISSFFRDNFNSASVSITADDLGFESVFISPDVVSPDVSEPIFPATDLLAAWNFDENTGASTSDASGNGHTGTLTSDILWTSSGKVGAALENDGTNYVNLGTGTNLIGHGSDFTHMAWVYMVSATDTVVIFDFGWRVSGTIPGNNVGLLFEIRNGEILVTVRQGSTIGYGGSTNGLWDTGLALQTGWNLVIVDRVSSGANAYVRNSTESISANLTASIGTLGQYQNRNYRILAGGGGTNDSTVDRFSTSGTRVDIAATWGRVITSDERDDLWNNGDGLQPS